MAASRILIVKLSSMGDVIHTLPAARSLKASFPDSSISWLVRPRWTPLLYGGALLTPVLALLGFAAGVTRRIGLGTAVLVLPQRQTALVAKLAGIPKRVGYAREGRRLLLTDPVDVPAWKETHHEAFYYLNLVAAIDGAGVPNDLLSRATRGLGRPSLHARSGGRIGSPPVERRKQGKEWRERFY